MLHWACRTGLLQGEVLCRSTYQLGDLHPQLLDSVDNVVFKYNFVGALACMLHCCLYLHERVMKEELSQALNYSWGFLTVWKYLEK